MYTFGRVKLWQIALDSPNSPKFSLTTVLHYTVYNSITVDLICLQILTDLKRLYLIPLVRSVNDAYVHLIQYIITHTHTAVFVLTSLFIHPAMMTATPCKHIQQLRTIHQLHQLLLPSHIHINIYIYIYIYIYMYPYNS